MQIDIGRCSSPSNYINKNVIYSSVQGYLKEGTSILDPVLVVDTTPVSLAINPPLINYVRVPEFERCYFVTDVVSVANNVWEISCHVDVLSSWKDVIKAQTAIIARQENLRNMYLDDGTFMAYQNPFIVTKYFSEEAPFEAQEYVLTVAGS